MEFVKHVAFLALAVAAVSKWTSGIVVAEEWKAWAPRLAQRLMRGAVRSLPSEKQGRYLEEWTAALADTPGFLWKILFAIDLYRASFLISKQSNQAAADKVIPAEAEAVRTIDPSKTDASRARETRQSTAHEHRRRVLVVDDEPVIARTLAIILEQSGYAARAAFSGEDGIALARDFRPQALIADVMMSPGINGIETGIQVRSFLPRCEIWLFVGQAASRDLLQRAAAAGYIFHRLEKPVHPLDLLSRLEMVSFGDSEGLSGSVK